MFKFKTNKLYLGEPYLFLPKVFQRFDQQIASVLYLWHKERKFNYRIDFLLNRG